MATKARFNRKTPRATFTRPFFCVYNYVFIVILLENIYIFHGLRCLRLKLTERRAYLKFEKKSQVPENRPREAEVVTRCKKTHSNVFRIRF